MPLSGETVCDNFRTLIHFTNMNFIGVGICILRFARPINVEFLRKSSFTSNISVQRLYPNSNQTLTTPKFQQTNSDIFSGYIPIDKLQISYSRSSGPGGQHVNMVNTKVDVRFHVSTADWVHENIRKRILEEHKTKITKDGFFVVRSEKTRSQQLNLADCLEKLRSLLWQLSETETTISPETEEKIRRQQEKAARIRLSEKRSRSLTLQQRLPPSIDL